MSQCSILYESALTSLIVMEVAWSHIDDNILMTLFFIFCVQCKMYIELIFHTKRKGYESPLIEFK